MLSTWRAGWSQRVGQWVARVLPMSARHAFDQTVQAEASEVVGHRSRRVGVQRATLELRDVIAELPVAKAGWGEGEETARVHEGVDAAVAEAQPGGALDLDDHGLADCVEGLFTDQARACRRAVARGPGRRSSECRCPAVRTTPPAASAGASATRAHSDRVSRDTESTRPCSGSEWSRWRLAIGAGGARFSAFRI